MTLIVSPRSLKEAASACRTALAGNHHLNAMIYAAFGGESYVDCLGIAPPYTESLDGARMLVPWGWYWRVGETTLYSGWAAVQAHHPDHCTPNQDEFFANKQHWKGDWTPELALVTACLEAWAFRYQRRYDWLAQRERALNAQGLLT